MSYFSVVNADAPDHWWRCADPGGLVLHDIGSPTRVLAYVKLFGSLPYTGPSSDGGSAFMQSGSAGGNNQIAEVLGPSSFSIEFWYFAPDQLATERDLVEIFGSGRLAILDVLSTGAVEFVIHGVPSNAGITSAVQTFNAWHHVVGTYDGATLRLYVDGALATSTAIATDMTGTYAVYIAQNSTGGNGGPTFLSDIALYGTILTPARVAAHFAAADLRTSSPVFQGNGIFPNASGGTTPNSVTQDFVSRVFQNAV